MIVFYWFNYNLSFIHIFKPPQLFYKTFNCFFFWSQTMFSAAVVLWNKSAHSLNVCPPSTWMERARWITPAWRFLLAHSACCFFIHQICWLGHWRTLLDSESVHCPLSLSCPPLSQSVTLKHWFEVSISIVCMSLTIPTLFLLKLSIITNTWSI